MQRYMLRKRGIKILILATFISFMIGFILIFILAEDKSGTSYFNSRSLNYKKFRKSIDANVKNFQNLQSFYWRNFLAGDKNDSKKNETLMSTKNSPTPKVNNNVHIFYYPWYGNPQFDRKYYHWNHPYLPHWNKRENAKWPQGVHEPPDDIGASFYPQLGAYSSRDPIVIDQHMKWIQMSGAGVVSISWYPPGDADNEGKQPDAMVPAILKAAHKYELKVNLHIEPFKNRNAETLKEQLAYIMEKYGKHPAFYKHYSASKKKYLPLFYIYDSYQVKPTEWAKIFQPEGIQTVRNTELDGIFIALLVERQHKDDIVNAGFDGFYNYFATEGFTYGSSWRNWRDIKKFAYRKNLIFIPSVGPGYIDTRVRAWNGHNIRDRNSGKYYISAIKSALAVGCEFLSITSFNEWHEGTQIEPAVPKQITNFRYLNYGREGSNFYLYLTKQLVMDIGSNKL